MRPTQRQPPPSIRLGVRMPLLLLGIAFALSSCAPAARNPYESGTANRARPGSRSYRVRFQVSCDVCNVTWQARNQRGTATDGGLWGETVVVHLMEGEVSTASLSASPLPGERGVSWIRISVNGKVVAEERQDLSTAGDRGAMRLLTVETPLPPPSG